MAELTHFDKSGAAHMVDVGDKEITDRIAIATGSITMAPGTFDLAASGNAKKGDVLGVARLAGIMAAKKTADLIPLCHPLPITKVAGAMVIDPVATAILSVISLSPTSTIWAAPLLSK